MLNVLEINIIYPISGHTKQPLIYQDIWLCCCGFSVLVFCMLSRSNKSNIECTLFRWSLRFSCSSFSACSCFNRDFLSSLNFHIAISNWRRVCLIISDPDFKLHVGGLLNPIPGKPFHLSPPHSIPHEEPSVPWGRQLAIFYHHSPLLHSSCRLSLLVCDSVSLIFIPPASLQFLFIASHIFSFHLHLILPIPSPSLMFLLSLPSIQPFVFSLMISDCQFEVSGSDGFVRSSQVEEEEKVKPGEALDCIWTIRAPPHSKVTFIASSLSFHTSQTLGHHKSQPWLDHRGLPGPRLLACDEETVEGKLKLAVRS